MSLRKKFVSGLFWTFGQQFGGQIISFIVSIILARILLPSDFGLIGMLSIFIGVGTSLIDSGLTSSLIRSENVDESDYSTVFFINLVGSVGIYLILFFCAPYIASFYNQPILEGVLRLYTLSFIINAFSGVQTAKLSKEMNFKLQMTIQIPALVVGGGVGIFCAFNGFGVWSLVYMYLVQSILVTAQLWIMSGWKPKLYFSKKKFIYHFNFGYKLTLSGLLSTLYNNIYNLIIGKFFSASQLGFYTRANTLKQLPVQNISFALTKVTYPLFSSIWNDDKRLKYAYKKLMLQVMFWLPPIMIYLAIVAEPLIKFLLGPVWLPAVPYFQILCAVGIMNPLNSYNLNILKVKGRSDFFLKLEVIKKLLITLGIFLTLPYGIYALLLFQLFFSVLEFFINSWYSGKLINYDVGEQIKDIAPEVALALLTGLVVWVLDYNFTKNIFKSDLIQLIVNGIIFSSLYLIISLLTKMTAPQDFLKLINKNK